MIEEYIIGGFWDQRTGRQFKNIRAYIGENRGAIIEDKGHIILLRREYIDEIMKKKIPYEISQKLISRSFFQSDKAIVCPNNKCMLDSMPEFFMIDLTRKCNMHCKYCLRDVTTSDQSISRDILTDICCYIIDYCKQYKLKDITIQPWGGEPLIELDNILYMKKMMEKLNTNVHFSIETNAILLNEDILDELYKNKIGIGISIDGYKELHDLQRVNVNGMPTHAKVEFNLMNAMKKYKGKVGTITTITKNNANYIEQILEYYAIELGLKNVKFNYVHKSMFTECEELCLSNEEISETELRMLDKIIELNEKGYEIAEKNIVTKLKNLLLKKYTDICHSNGCSGGRKMIVFDMLGNIYPCELTDVPKEKIGNIYEDADLPALIKHSLTTKDFFEEKREEKCNDCMWYEFCKGGCTVRAISKGRRPPKIDEIECTVNTVLYPALMKLIVEKPGIVNKLIGEEIITKG